MTSTHHHVPLSDRCRVIILGSLLGDGSLQIHARYRNARFSFRHSIGQKEYFFWKAQQLKQISALQSIFQQENDGFSDRPKLRFQSRALENLTELYRLTHTHGKLDVRRSWLNQLTPLSLAIWWLDDGSLISNGRKGVFCTDGFDEATNELLAKYLRVVWKVQVHVARIGRKREGRQRYYYRLWIRSTEELKKFLRLILPEIRVPSMLSKVIILYTDPQLQQRWISEVAHLTNFSEAMVHKAMLEKKAKWRRYRE